MPAICRGDMEDVDVVHCEVPHRLERSPDVFVNSIGISRQGDKNHPHLKSAPICPIPCGKNDRSFSLVNTPGEIICSAILYYFL